MNICFVEEAHAAIPIFIVKQKEYDNWVSQQTPFMQNWLKTTQCKADVGVVRLLPSAQGALSGVLCCVADVWSFWRVGHLPQALPPGVYCIDHLTEDDAIAWGLGAYQFTRYKSPKRESAQLVLPERIKEAVDNVVNAINLVRDLINTPAEEMGPTALAQAAEMLAKSYQAHFSQTIGDDLLTQHYPAIHAVGRASADAPRLLEITWGDSAHPLVTLVGKGVCFDSGGLDIKSASGMLLMKKDMGGAAHVLGLARMIMQAKLPVRLRVLIPAVENAIAGNAYRPGDVIQSRKGLSIEVGNTDAEGRVVLADALALAVDEKPALLIDMATLTGAARIALGTELPAVFCNQDALVRDVLAVGEKAEDPMWQLPLFAPYREYINSQIADISNNPADSYGSAITAALFLKEFVPDHVPWLHFDIMAWNLRARPGRPVGGEAMGLRALFAYIKSKFRGD
ncbi:MAG TPA: leucyl aminopeptidase family protein [Gammaproteobacteria bacterium]|jgi:leucyl aminopeptidase|nr:leucyl aminopeptidase family protein [Gammaproteobacteria bacterium]